MQALLISWCKRLFKSKSKKKDQSTKPLGADNPTKPAAQIAGEQSGSSSADLQNSQTPAHTSQPMPPPKKNHLLQGITQTLLVLFFTSLISFVFRY